MKPFMSVMAKFGRFCRHDRQFSTTLQTIRKTYALQNSVYSFAFLHKFMGANSVKIFEICESEGFDWLKFLWTGQVIIQTDKNLKMTYTIEKISRPLR
jgi:hypothetical protein